MNSREKRIRIARIIISDERLLAFLRAIRGKTCLLAVKLINEDLDKGNQLDDIFYTGEEYGFTLDVKQKSESSFKIAFGCIPGPNVGDGGEWKVCFDGNKVISVKNIELWII